MVHCYVKNTGSVDGDEVVQLYIDDTEGSVVRPPMLLKEFKRIHLKAGEEKPVFFPLTPLSFRLMDIHYYYQDFDLELYVGQLETDVVQIERIDAQHEEEGECAGIDANIFT